METVEKLSSSFFVTRFLCLFIDGHFFFLPKLFTDVVFIVSTILSAFAFYDIYFKIYQTFT